MNVWYHLSTIFNRRHALRIAGLIALCVALITALLFAAPTHAATGTNQTLSFQGRLSNKTGGILPDGYYNIQFKLYQDGNGTAAGNPGSTLKWTESYVNNGTTGGVEVKNGYFSVNLGSKNPFGTSVDWNQDTLWLSMNVAGSSASCTTFGTGACAADGEMVPMKRISAIPQALNSARLGGLTSDGFIQNTTTAQTANFNVSGSGTANTLQGITSVNSPLFDRATSGILSIGTVNATTVNIATNNADHTVSIATGTGNQIISVGSLNGTSATTINGGNGITLNSTNAITLNGNTTIGNDRYLTVKGSSMFQNATDSSSAFTIQNASGVSLLSVDTAKGYVINNGISNADNLLENPGFEVGTGISGNASGWLAGIFVNDGNARSGNQAMLVSGPDHDYATTKYYAVQPGQVIYYGGYVKHAAGSSGTGGFYIEAKDKNFSNTLFSAFDTWTDPGTSYAYRSNTYTVPAGKYFIRMAATTRSNAVGNWYFDDLYLKVASVQSPSFFKNASDSSTAFQIQTASGTTLLNADTNAQNITLGDPASANKTVISASGQIRSYGTARNTKKISLNAEYTGAVLDSGTGSNNSGIMTSSVDLSNRMNYYNWSTSGTNQSYDVVVQVPLPNDYDGWASSTPLNISSYTTNTTSGTIKLESRDSNGNTETSCSFAANTSLTPTSSFTWSSANSSNCTIAGTYAAGDNMMLRIRMQASSGTNVRIGNISLNYLSKY